MFKNKKINILGLILICVSILSVGSVKAFPSSIGPIRTGARQYYDAVYFPLKYYGSTAVFCTQFSKTEPTGINCYPDNSSWDMGTRVGVGTIIQKVGKISANSSLKSEKYYYGEVAINKFEYQNSIYRGQTAKANEVYGDYKEWIASANAAKKEYNTAKNGKITFTKDKLNFDFINNEYVAKVKVNDTFSKNYKAIIESTTNKNVKVSQSNNEITIKIANSKVKPGEKVSVKIRAEYSKSFPYAQKYKCEYGEYSYQSVTPNIVETTPVTKKATISGSFTKPAHTITINKVDAENSNVKLTGAEFKLYKGSDCRTSVSNTKYTTNKGVVKIKGLETGTYSVEEVTAPKGYQLDTTTCKSVKFTKNDTAQNLSLTFKNKVNKITVKKVDSTTHAPLNHAEFHLFDNKKDCIAGANPKETNLAKIVSTGTKTKNQLTSGNDGVAVFKGMSSDITTYYVREEAAPDGYQNKKKEADKCKAVTLNNSSAVVFENIEIGERDIEVKKIDAYTGLVINGVQIELYEGKDCTGTLKDTKTTSGGKVIFTVEQSNIEGTNQDYSVKEKSVPSGYLPEEGDAPKCYNVKIGSSKADKRQTIKNRPYGNIKLLKRDSSTKKPMKGIKFRLLDKDKNPAKDINGNVVAEATTDSNGNIEFKNLLYGIYYIEELTNDKSYKKIEGPIEIELDKEIDSVKLKDRGPEKYILGDVNDDKLVNSSDITFYNNVINGTTDINSLTPKIQGAFDVNQDLIYDIIDKSIVEYYVNYLESTDSEVASAADSYSERRSNVCQAFSYEEDCNIDRIHEVKTWIENNTSIDSISQTDYPDVYGYYERYVNAETQEKKEEMVRHINYFLDGRAILCRADGQEDNCVINEEYLKLANKVGSTDTLKPEEAEVSIVISNEKIDMKISKQSITDTEELPGAKIIITDEKGKKIIEFTSGKEPKEFNIPAGVYTLKEKVAPKGYQELETSIKFEVGQDGNVKLLSAESNLYKLQESENGDIDHLIIKNYPIQTVEVPDTGANISKIAIISGIVLILGGGFVLNKKGYLKKIIKH